jgi:hypothetical protein
MDPVEKAADHFVRHVRAEGRIGIARMKIEMEAEESVAAEERLSHFGLGLFAGLGEQSRENGGR